MVRIWGILTILFLISCVVSEQIVKKGGSSKDKTHEEQIQVPVAGGAKVVVPVKSSKHEEQLPETSKEVHLIYSKLLLLFYCLHHGSKTSWLNDQSTGFLTCRSWVRVQ